MRILLLPLLGVQPRYARKSATAPTASGCPRAQAGEEGGYGLGGGHLGVVLVGRPATVGMRTGAASILNRYHGGTDIPAYLEWYGDPTVAQV